MLLAGATNQRETDVSVPKQVEPVRHVRFRLFPEFARDDHAKNERGEQTGRGRGR